MSDADEEQLRDLYRAGADEQPSAELDRRILAAAAAATRQRQRRRWLPGSGGPLAGLATAAVVVLAVAVLVRQNESPTSVPEALQAVPEALQAVPEAPQAPAAESKARRATGDADASAPVPPAALGAAAAEREVHRAAGVEPAEALADNAPARADAGAAAGGPEAELQEPVARQETVAAEGRVEAARRDRTEADRPALQAIPATAPARTAFAAAGCAEPYPLPDGSTVRTLDGDLEVSVGGERWTLRCVDGAWVREPPADQSNR